MTADKPAPSGRLYGRDSLATPSMVVATALAVSLGGYLLPVVGCVAGIVMMWLSPAWTRGQKLIATLTPLALAAVAVAMAVAGATGAHLLIIAAIGCPLPVGIWLLIVGLRRISPRR